MKILFKNLLLLAFAMQMLACDSKKSYFDDVGANLLCETYAICGNETPARYGIIGDSWTDLLLGYPFVETLRYQLENYHGYQFVGATLGGKTLQRVVNEGLQFQVIDQAGADVHSIILSLGGNDIQANLEDYIGDIPGEQARRFNILRTNLLNLVSSGNIYKVSKFGGQPIRWIIHGYDYPNPFKGAAIADSDEGCKTKFDRVGLVVPDAAVFTSEQLDALNTLYISVSTEDPTLYYTDLRGTLGGKPASNPDLMVDCIHPNNLGFRLLGERMASQILPITNVGF